MAWDPTLILHYLKENIYKNFYLSEKVFGKSPRSWNDALLPSAARAIATGQNTSPSTNPTMPFGITIGVRRIYISGAGVKGSMRH